MSKDMANADHCYGAALERAGFRRRLVEEECRKCYTVRDFAAEHPDGTYVLDCNGHVIAIRDGDWYDT